MDRLDSMATLVAVVDYGGLSAAARKLGLPLTTVSRRVRDLEAHLRTSLLQQSGRRLAPTAAGSAYIAACREILASVGEAEREAAGEFASPSGDLIVSAPLAFGRLHATPVIAQFLEAFPAITARLMLTDRQVDLAEDRVDVAIRVGDLPDSALVARTIGTTRPIVCASPAYIEARGAPLRPADLPQHACVARDGLLFGASWSFGHGDEIETVAIRARLRAGSAEAVLEAAIASVGIARAFCYQVAEAVRAGRLVLLLRDYEPPARPISLVHAPLTRLPLKVRAFMDFAAPRLRDRLRADAT